VMVKLEMKVRMKTKMKNDLFDNNIHQLQHTVWTASFLILPLIQYSSAFQQLS
jgi:hypothetical protein